MEKLTEFAASNPNYVRKCILYEMLQKKPIFDSYRDFCKNLGDDVMDYPDFEYWYYRFYHGNMDFDHDPSTEPKQKRIGSLPPEILSMIFEKLHPVERAYIRNMNRLFKRTADIHSPIFEEITFYRLITSCSFSLGGKYVDYINNGLDSCIVQKNGRIGKKVNANYRNLCIQNLCQVLALPNTQIQNFFVFLKEDQGGISSQEIENFSERIHVTSLRVECRDKAPVMTLLSKMVPGELKTISLTVSGYERRSEDRIYETEQFKKAEHVDLLQFTTVSNFNEFVHFEHLKTFKVSFPSMNPPDIVKLRDMLSSSTIFEECTICTNSAPFSFGRALGVDIPAGRMRSFTHRHSIPNSDAFLEFNVEGREIHIKKVHSSVV